MNQQRGARSHDTLAAPIDRAGVFCRRVLFALARRLFPAFTKG